MGDQVRQLDEAAKIPEPGDKVAIAIETLEPGTEILRGDMLIRIGHSVLEGHRFAIDPIAEGEPLLSWGLPFGHALQDIAPGDYACNEKILRVLNERHPASALRREGGEPDGTHDQGPGRIPGGFRTAGLHLPAEPNFRDAELTAYTLDASFRPGTPVPRVPEPGTFLGYRRPGRRGVGTRNHIVVLGVTSRTSAYAKTLERRLNPLAEPLENVDGVVAVAHTEGGEDAAPNNLELLLRALSGFVVHPNVGAVLIVDEPGAAVDSRMLRDYLEEHGYPLADVPHRFLGLRGGFEHDLAEGEQIVRAWLSEVDAARRTAEPLSELRIALQCGARTPSRGSRPTRSWAGWPSTSSRTAARRCWPRPTS